MTFLQTALEFVTSYKFVIFFYLVLAILIFIYRKKFQVENKFILIRRTDFGIKFMNKFADKHSEFIKIIGYSAIGIGFAGMITICGFILKGLYDLIFVPSAPPTVSLVIPGVQIPGSPVFVPFWYGIIALFIVVLFHEFGHGIVARAHGIKIKSTGIVFFGPIIGAFVEPDEKKMTKYDSTVQQSIFASGPFFNAILAAFALLVLFLMLNPLLGLMVTEHGVTFDNVQDKYPAQIYGVEKGIAYTSVNGKTVSNSQEFITELSCVRPNETVVLGNENKNVTVITGISPTDSSKGYIGVSGIKTDYTLKSENIFFKIVYYILFFLTNLFEWIFMLSLGIGLANLLPLGPVDGGRMMYTALTDVNGKKGIKIWSRITMILLIILVILIFVPIIKSLLFKV